MKHSFDDDPELSARVFDLLDLVFPGIRAAADHGRTLGDSWESISTPFVHEEDGRVVSHAGVIELSLQLEGRVRTVGSVHAVATHPDFRRRGLYRRLMEELLEDCDSRIETLILSTENPEYYELFGFRLVPEHGFRVRCDSPATRGGLRRLDTEDSDDLSLLRRLLTTRAPVSNVVGVVRDTAVFCVAEGGRPLHYSPALDAILVMNLKDGHLELFDVVAPEIPSLESILEMIPHPVKEATIAFSPDRLAVEAEPFPWVFDAYGPSLLMARGPFVAPERPFTLQRSGRT